MDAADFEGGPFLRELRRKADALGRDRQTEESLGHDERHEQGFVKFLIDAQAAGRATALQRPAFGGRLRRVVFAVAARGLHLSIPREDLLEPRPGVIGSVGP